MLRRTAGLCLGVLLTAPFASFAQTGAYTWTLSASNADPFVNRSPNPGPGTHTFYLWNFESCSPAAGPGLAAAEAKIVTPPGWSVTSFVPSPAFLVATTSMATDGVNLLVVSASCPAGPVVIGTVQIACDGSAGALELGPTDVTAAFSGRSVLVDCQTQVGFAWPDEVRFVGYSTTDGPANQDCGNGCTAGSAKCGKPSRKEVAFDNLPRGARPSSSPPAQAAFDLSSGDAVVRGSTGRVTFDLPRSGPVSLRVFDVTGRPVATVVDRAMSRGAHTATWSAAALPSGVYFYRLEAGGETRTRKVIRTR